jgi:superfamily II DNA helicase RecQ
MFYKSSGPARQGSVRGVGCIDTYLIKPGEFVDVSYYGTPIYTVSKTTLIFINTRGMSEMWYQTLLTFAPQLSGAIALHHGSIEQQLRLWVEDALHEGKLKAVVCTGS